jgi:hypothetical protein
VIDACANKFVTITLMLGQGLTITSFSFPSKKWVVSLNARDGFTLF